MIIVDNALGKREETNDPIKVAIVGTGAMGQGMINQITRHTPGMKIVAAYNRSIEKALAACETAGLKNYYLSGDDIKKARAAMNSGQPFITGNIDLLLELNGIDILVEATGTIEFALRTILIAFARGLNVLSFNAELDSTFGPLLKKRAAETGVKYSLGDGDQPGVTMNLYRYVKGMGFNPLLCGNIKGLQDHYRNPKTQKSFAADRGMTPEMVTSFADGSKISFEQSCIANATGMKVAQRGMLGYQSKFHIDDLKNLYDINRLKELGGIVDYVIGAKPSPGVFIYATTDDPDSIKYLKYSKMGKGPLYSFYVPYHLLFFDIASSICRLLDFNDFTITPKAGPVVEVITAAKTNMKPGTVIDGIGGYKVYGLCENISETRKENLIPLGLTEGLTVKKEIKTDQVLTFNDVEIDQENFLLANYQEQCKLFDLEEPHF